MKRPIAFFFFAVLLHAISAFAQPTSENARPPDPYKATLDRLDSLTTLPLPEWRFHTDVPHPESPLLDDSSWEVMKVGDNWTSGPRVLRRWIEIPEKINRYAIRDGNAQHAMVCSFITSAEYQLRFGSVVTHSNRECPQ